jgi:hypothetical protein
MRKLIAALFALPLAGLQAQPLVNSFDDIQFWTGSGTNRAALVLQWNDGKTPVSLTWGFRWNGNATGIDMLMAIAGSTAIEDEFGEPLGSTNGTDSRLKLGLIGYSFGKSVFSVAFSPTGGTTRSRSDWISGYWQYLIRGGDFEYTDWGATEPSRYNVPGSPLYAPNSWFSSPIGAGDRTLINGAWDAYSFAPQFAVQPVVQPSAAPLPKPAVTCSMVAGQPNIAFTGEVGFFYTLQVSSHPSGPWTSTGSPLPGNGGSIVFVDQIPSAGAERPANRFYRIAVSR